MARVAPSEPFVHSSVALPYSLHQRLRGIAAREGVTLSRLVRSWATALAALDQQQGSTGIDPRCGDTGSENQVRVTKLPPVAGIPSFDSMVDA